ncbi:hypothetical protein IPU75_08405 [Ochrobactrum sp. SD129]|nr:hypothetical protein [Ochrobactrum sp. SD129]
MYYADRPIFAKTPAEKAWRDEEYRRLRSALSLSQVELAKVAGLAVSSVNQLPYRSRYISLAVLERMRGALEERNQQRAA